MNLPRVNHSPRWDPRLVFGGVLLLSVAQVALPARASARVIRVDSAATTSASCGEDWSTPCALLAALQTIGQSGDEIWAKAGTYVGGNKTFLLKNGLALYGGFAGTEVSREERDWATNVTILVGRGTTATAHRHGERH